MGIFTDNFNAGVSGGGALAQLLQQTRDRKTQRTLAENFGRDGDFNALGTGLIGLGKAGQGLNAINVPYKRDQQELQREFQNQQFEATQQQRAFQNQLATQGFGLRQQQFQNDKSQQQFTNDLATQRLELAQSEAERQAQGGGGFSTQLVPAFDGDGNPVFVQGSESGGVRPVEGFTPATRGVKVDRGTHIDVVNPSTGETIKKIEKDNFTPARDKAAGGAEGKRKTENRLDAPRAQRQAQEAINVIDGILNHPSLGGAVGVRDSKIPDLVAGQGVVDFRARAAQLEGKAFLEAVQRLKGGGQITEIEGEKATAAIGRLSQAQSEGAYRNALIELKGILTTAKQRAADLQNAPRLPRGIGNGISFSRDSRVTPASGDTVPVSEDELQDLLGKY